MVIPAYNPRPWLREAVASAYDQTHGRVEVILVDDGSDSPESRAVLEMLSSEVTRFIQQPNRGVSAARNAGCRAAKGEFIVQLDSDDLLERDFVEVCVAELTARPEAAFAYTDFRVFGRKHYVERLADYNLFRLLAENTIGYACLIHKNVWDATGGYDESLVGYEDWELWLRLGGQGHFGHHIDRVLFRYRKHGRSLVDVARERHEELVARIRARHAQLYSPDAYAAIKAKWEPAAAVIAAERPPAQTIQDYQISTPGNCRDLLARTAAPAFALTRGGPVDPQTAELAALAVWAGQECIELADGSLAASRAALAARERTDDVCPRARPRHSRTVNTYADRAGPLDTFARHLSNAELLSVEAWTRHPVQSLTRMIPLRAKEAVNRVSGRTVFDLSFYLQFQPRAVLLNGSPVAPIEYLPPRATRKRIALVTPHLGPGGAETVLLDVASACGRARYEISVIAMQSRDDRWRERWRESADHIYDLAAFVPPERIPAVLYSIAVNWRFDHIFIQNSLPAYSMAAELKRALPEARLIDLIHTADNGGWDLIKAARAALPFFDVHVAISDAVRNRLVECGVRPERVRLIPNGVDLERFQPAPDRVDERARILFAARLDPVKRPLLVADIAAALKQRRPRADFVFAVAGDGSERDRLVARIRQLGIEDLFEFSGHVEDMAPLFASSDLLVLTSEIEGVPLVVLEAMASACPVIASDTGAIHEVLDEHTGVLIPKSEREAEEFAAAIDGLLNSDASRRRLGERGRRRVERGYSRERALESYRELFG